MTYRPVDATSGWTQIWNGENRMVETYRGSDRLTFKYDYMGRRVEKCVYSGNILTSRTLFVYDGFKCVEELDALNNSVVSLRHAWQPFDAGLDVILATADGNATSFFLHDANKNVMQKTDINGLIWENYVYAPFGKNTSIDNARIGFSSEVFEKEIRLVYYNNRYLQPHVGRWGSRDAIGETGGYNLFSFTNNCPINRIDFLGFSSNDNDSCSNNACRSLVNNSIDNLMGISAEFPGKTGELMQMLQTIKSFYDTYSTYKDETPQLIESFNRFISAPAQDTCYEACMSFYRLYGNLLGGFGYFKCHCICSKF